MEKVSQKSNGMKVIRKLSISDSRHPAGVFLCFRSAILERLIFPTRSRFFCFPSDSRVLFAIRQVEKTKNLSKSIKEG